MTGFRLGINYWPARTAMGWWSEFEPFEVAADFARVAASGFDSVRLFLTWEDFQPSPTQVDSAMIGRLLTTLDLANERGLVVMPTLFTGHMSGVNWIPAWALGGSAGDARFRVVSAGAAHDAGLRNWYTDPDVLSAQCKLASELAGALAGHAALLAWDLGNENSNCVIPPNKALARAWLMRISDSIRNADSTARITLGLHMEDLEQDRNLGPAEAAEVCDFLTMHGYPGYAQWARGSTDAELLPFLAGITRWLGGGCDVLFSEFGVPTRGSGDTERGAELAQEQDQASYIERALEALLGSGCTGAMLWCYSDYVSALWQCPPFDRAVHERSFGLWRADASPKPALAAVVAFAKSGRVSAPAASSAWIDIAPQELYRAPARELPRLYRRYCETR